MSDDTESANDSPDDALQSVDAEPSAKTAAEIAAQLRDLPPVAMPAAVGDRIVAALAQTPPLVAGADPEVAQLDAARHRRQDGHQRTRWSGRMVTAAASVAAVLVVSGVVVNQLESSSSGSSGSSGSTATSAELGAVPRTASGVRTASEPWWQPVVVRSNNQYNDQNLPAELNTVLASSVVPLNEAASQQFDSATTTSPTPKSTPTTASPPVNANKQLDQRSLNGSETACMSTLLAGVTTRPLALDYARFSGRPALIVAFPGRYQAQTVEVFVVPPGCPGGVNVPVLYYRVLNLSQLPALASFALPQPAAS